MEGFSRDINGRHTLQSVASYLGGRNEERLYSKLKIFEIFTPNKSFTTIFLKFSWQFLVDLNWFIGNNI